MSEKKQTVDLGLLEEDDEFEEFPAEGGWISEMCVIWTTRKKIFDGVTAQWLSEQLAVLTLAVCLLC